ncbi:uncharacterized protein K441DRAFT_606397 [Cenococcum geophilum 1.58]|uniref:uncharacterized protein n=1 Tax=Cenococcum geophilum 1.58 TaxID=794803 RepID=UPI00358E9928|nr:hypothetical protein K441DRAFT_606397 [Cenococcum geophilum 1.58]
MSAALPQSVSVGVAAAEAYPTTHFSGTEGAYMLPHHAKEIERLQRQHHFMNSTTEGKLLVTPNTKGFSPLRILDAGCADGTWLRDVPRQFPDRNLELFGVDIGSTLFPGAGSGSAGNPATTTPDLRAHNILHPFPSSWKWKNTFDIVHQRLLIWGIASKEWSAVVRNLVELLKPGGYIQLVEVEWIDPLRPASLPQLKKQAALQEWSTKGFGMDIHVAYQLEGYLRDAGLENVIKIQFDHGYGAKSKDPEQADVSAELLVECFRSLDQKIGPDGIPSVARNAKEFHAFLDALEVEIKTYGYQPKLNFVYGRKPL